MITLVTGSPGAGKTLWMVKELVENLVPTNRPIYTNITGLNIPNADNVHQCDLDTPFKWMDYEDGAIFVFDEIQKQYPARHSTSRVPKHIEEFQTHRHKGMDFYFVTQGPKLIDRSLHDLTERHVHLFRAFGMPRSKVSEYGAVNDTPQPPQSYSSALKRKFVFPKAYYPYYRSASQHTVQTKLPWHVIIPAILLILVTLSLVFFVAMKVKSGFGTVEVTKKEVDTLRPVLGVPTCPFSVVGVSGSGLLVKMSGSLTFLPRTIVKQKGSAYYVIQQQKECQIA